MNTKFKDEGYNMKEKSSKNVYGKRPAASGASGASDAQKASSDYRTTGGMPKMKKNSKSGFYC